MSLEDVDYYRARASAELARADLAPSEKIARLHRELATRYDELSVRLASGDLSQDRAPHLRIVPQVRSGTTAS